MMIFFLSSDKWNDKNLINYQYLNTLIVLWLQIHFLQPSCGNAFINSLAQLLSIIKILKIHKNANTGSQLC